MTLQSGARLGSYEVIGPLGAGGMGEVYRARDSRLGRDVAIKVLPAALSAEPTRLRRFEKEARAASALNHPNIVTIYEIGADVGTSYIAMELVSGKTLREILLSGPVALRKLLQIAAPLAEGLSAAHEAGIVHRDLKPENVMVTREGLVKILDFGLAKLSAAIGSGEESLPTVSHTEPGGLVGTVTYMSPEQAAGQPADFRSDQFSAGSILYEMTTGRRAFQRATTVDTLSAILHEEPQSPAALCPEMPAPLAWVIERCLAKDPADRYASTRDLAGDLKKIRDHVSTPGTSAGFAAPGSRLRKRRAGPMALVLAGALTLCVAGAFLLGRQTDPVRRLLGPVRSSRVTFRRGGVTNARFAPDGETIVYSASWEGSPQEIYVTSIHGAESRALGIPRSQLLAVSRQGDLAVLEKSSGAVYSSLGYGTLARATMTGGALHEILEGATWVVDWSPQGELAVRRDVGAATRIEYPLGRPIYETTRGRITSLRVSPDGQRVAFWDPTGHGWNLAVVDRAGRKRILLSMEGRYSSWGYLAWHPSGEEIWFDAIEGEKSPGIFAVSLSGERRVLMRPALRVVLTDVSRDGRVLVDASWMRAELLFGRLGEDREIDLSWLGDVSAGDISRDGKTILFSETGEGSGPEGGVYLRGTDGSPAVRLSDGLAQGLSPDGKWALVLVRSSPPRLSRVPTGPGEAMPVPVGNLTVRGAAWVPDGRRIYLRAVPPGGELRGYLMELPSGPLRPFGPENPQWAVFSPDSRLALIGRPDGRQLLYPLDGGAPQPVPGLLPEEISDPLSAVGPFTGDGRGVYLAHFRDFPLRIDRLDLATGARSAWKDLAPGDRAGVTRIDDYTIGADGRSYAYSVARNIASAMYVIEGLE